MGQEAGAVGACPEAEHVEQTWCGSLERNQRLHADRTWPPRSSWTMDAESEIKAQGAGINAQHPALFEGHESRVRLGRGWLIWQGVGV